MLPVTLSWRGDGERVQLLAGSERRGQMATLRTGGLARRSTISGSRWYQEWMGVLAMMSSVTEGGSQELTRDNESTEPINRSKRMDGTMSQGTSTGEVG